MAKIFDPNRSVDSSYMMRLSHAIAEHRGIFTGLCLGMLFWFALGGFAMRNEHVGENRPLSSSLRAAWSVDDYLFWSAVAGGFFTLVGGWAFFHKQMEADAAAASADPQTLAEEIAKFKGEKQVSAREERIRRLKERQSPGGASPPEDP